MKTDLYAKTMLTIIAGALVWMCASGRSIVPPAQAQTRAPEPRSLVGIIGWVDAQGRSHPFDQAPLPVKVIQTQR